MEEQTKKRILVVDATPNNLTLLVYILTDAGYNASIASSGEYDRGL